MANREGAAAAAAAGGAAGGAVAEPGSGAGAGADAKSAAAALAAAELLQHPLPDETVGQRYDQSHGRMFLQRSESHDSISILEVTIHFNIDLNQAWAN